MAWVPGTNIRIDPFATAGGHKVKSISTGSPSPITHMIEIENGTTLPYTVWVEGRSQVSI
jgi:hypothetical protein